MKINFKSTEKNVALLKKLASKDRTEREAAHVSLAEFIGPVLQRVINAAPTLSNLYTKITFNENDSPSLPLDTYAGITQEDYLRVWSQAEAGGMPFNQPTPPSKEVKFMTYSLDSAVAFSKKYAAQSRLDVVGKTFERLVNEVMLKQERNAAAVLLRAAAQATSTVKGAATYHVIRSAEADRFILHDFNKLFTLMKRINTAWNFGTPMGRFGRGLTDIVVSPEIVQELRALAYNPVNTKAGVTTTSGAVGIALPDATREEIYKTAGIPEFYGVNIIESAEFGVGYAYNDLFDAFAGSNAYIDRAMTSTAVFDGSSEELVLGLDLSSDALIRPVAIDAEGGAEFRVEPDNQFADRSGKIGFWGKIEEGRVIVNDKCISVCLV